MSVERRRCVGVGAECGKPIVMAGPRQSGVYWSSEMSGQLVRRPLCWQCYDIARGAKPRPNAPTEVG